jgi:hypothetical protein
MVNRRYVGADVRNSQAEILASVDTAIKNANNRLNTGCKNKLTLERRGNKIYLKGTLPIHPSERSEGTKRYYLPFGNANLKAIVEAEEKCREVDTHLRTVGSDWWILIPQYQEKQTEATKLKLMKDIKLEFEKDYWLNREKTRKSLATWEKSYSDIFLKIPDNELLTESNIVKWLEQTQPNSKPRLDLLRVVKCLAEHCGVKEDINWKRFKCTYKPQKRILPTDDFIESTFDGMPKEIGWTFGMIATYGLRPSELFQLTNECIKRFTDSSNKRCVLYIPDDTKTGEREVYPLHPEWVQRFDLLNVRRLKTEAKKLETKISWLNKLFHKYGFNQPAYDLRHRYAVRACELRVLMDIAAKWMGHSVEEHCKTYQKWMDTATHHKAFDTMLEIKKELTEVEKLKLEINWLKEENSKLKAQLELYQKAHLNQ